LRNKLAPIIVDATPRRSTSSLGSALGPVGRIGIISDTHGLLRPEAATFLRGCNHILHGGDIGNGDILTQLAAIAPTTAVRGNNDKGAWAETLPETELFEFSGIHVYVIHDLSQLDIDPSAAGIRAVISGHSHKPRIEQRDGVFFINPGSAGPRRFKLPVSVAELLVDGNTVSSRIVELDIHGAT
jgi:putative phosphoesterase